MNNNWRALIAIIGLCALSTTTLAGADPAPQVVIEGANKVERDNFSLELRTINRQPGVLAGALGHFRSQPNLCIDSIKIFYKKNEIDVPSVLLNVMCNPRTIKFKKMAKFEVIAIEGGDGGESYLTTFEIAPDRILRVIARYGESPDVPIWILQFPKIKSENVLDK